mmetsp:Transcript_17618/g.27250  ORF Transcript_17618/g.27250 Transcript_17618/m.27250 type:complete len:131 (-) Transcript_17618:678-1070(-)
MKIRSVSSTRLIKIFRKKFNVKNNIQFLIFGQIIPEGGFRNEKDNDGASSFKTVRTQDLKELRDEELMQKNEIERYSFARYQLNQFNQVKKIIINMTLKDKGKSIISPEIIVGVLDEMRTERKIDMVLSD